MSQEPPDAPPLGRNSVKRACDGCKIRKIKCSNTTPCSCCLAARIPCTFNKNPHTRGPRKLRTKTIQQIVDVQRRESLRSPIPSVADLTAPCLGPSIGEGRSILQAPKAPLPALVASPPTGFGGSPPAQRSAKAGTPVATLVLQLCVYRLRMFPVWPVVAVEDLMAALNNDSQDMEAYALANAVGAATVAQLKLSPTRNSAELVTAESMESEVQRVRSSIPVKLNLNSMRTAFFLHVYHENLAPGGLKSLLYLREAITMAQIMELHRESSYEGLSDDEQQFRRRILWLLFVTERGVAMLHKLPVVLKANISFPAMEYPSEVSILPAFRKLVNLFWILDQFDVFGILQSSSSTTHSGISTTQNNILNDLQKKLQDISVDSGVTNDIQAADICVTRAWMRVVCWRMTINSLNCGRHDCSDARTGVEYLTQIAKEFLAVISKLPSTAIESHGPSMELKVYEIAYELVDSISKAVANSNEISDEALGNVYELQQFLSFCRGNTDLVERLQTAVSKILIADSFVGNPKASSQFGAVNRQWRSDSERVAEFGFEQPVLSPDLQQQQSASFLWDAIAEKNYLPDFGETFELSAVLDRFPSGGLD